MDNFWKFWPCVANYEKKLLNKTMYSRDSCKKMALTLGIISVKLKIFWNHSVLVYND